MSKPDELVRLAFEYDGLFVLTTVPTIVEACGKSMTAQQLRELRRGLLDAVKGQEEAQGVRKSAPLAWPPTCQRCAAPLTEPGALLFGPPDATGRTEKIHICCRCWTERPRWVVARVEADL